MDVIITIDRLEERGVERGSARRSFLKGRKRGGERETVCVREKERERERAIVSQINIKTFKGNAWETSDRRGRAHIGFPEHEDIILT